MSYIGKQPAVGNFVKLDAITTSSTNTYNLTLDSVAFTPESANHMLVSLNGVIQAPLTAFSVSGSTITFLPSSGTLSSSDVIDFIMVYGNVLDIGTPSDSTVTNAKTNFVSTSSSAGLQIKGDNTTAGTLQLNCEQNSHGIKLRSPPHSAGQSYTLTFPSTAPATDKILQTDSSGVLSFVDAGGGITEIDMWRLTTNDSGVQSEKTLSSNWERNDSAWFSKTGTGMTESSGEFTFPSTGKWHIFFSAMVTAGGTNYAGVKTQVSTDSGSSYSTDTEAYAHTSGSSDYEQPKVESVIDVANASTYRVRFRINSQSPINFNGSTATNYTWATFIRLGDT